MVDPAAPRSGLLVCDDLLFISRVTGTAQALGLKVRDMPLPGAAIRALAAEPAPLVLLDLSMLSLSADRMREIVTAAAAGVVIAFGSHVDVERLREAAEAGCREVLPRSQFVARLSAILTTHLRGAS